MSQHNNDQDKQILAEYQDGLEPLIEDVKTALKVITEAGYQDVTDEANRQNQQNTYRVFVHPDYEGVHYCFEEQDVIDLAVGLEEGTRAMQATLQEALPELSDEEAARLADEASKHW